MVQSVLENGKDEIMCSLTAEEIRVLENIEDHRYVLPELKNAFCSGGLSEFRKFILHYNKKEKRDHNKLAILLRGNGNSIIIYQNNHKIWELSVGKSFCKVSFDFNHARFSPEWSNKLNELTEKWGFQLPNHRKGTELLHQDRRIKITRNDHKDVIGGEIGTISCKKESFDEEFVKNTYKIITKLVKDFFKSQSKDYFREEVSKDPKYRHVKDIQGSGAGVLVEKRWQQRLLFYFNDMMDGYYAYDLEFSQKYPDKDYVEKFAKANGPQYSRVRAIDIKEKLGTNEPDMLALRFENGRPQALVLIEVKSTESACKGKSDVKKHMEGMNRYAQQELFMKKRRTDAYESLCQYKEMGIIDNDVEIKSIPYKVEKVLILTNSNVEENEGGTSKESALDYFKANKKKIYSWSKENECAVWTICSNYWDSSIVINKEPFKEER